MPPPPAEESALPSPALQRPVAPGAWRALRRGAGALVVVAALAMLAVDAYRVLAGAPHLGAAWTGGCIAALATAAGALPVLLANRLADAWRDALTGFGAGVMLAACAFSLVIPGLAASRALGAGPWGAGLVQAGGMLAGAAALLALDALLAAQQGRRGPEPASRAARRRALLFVLAIVLHNVPEGLAIGVAHAGSDAGRAVALTTGIALQDVPEGFVVAMALVATGTSRGLAVGFGMASGLVEPLGALLGALLGAAVIGLSAALLPWGLAFAAGAMLCVVCHAMVPDLQREPGDRAGTVGLMVGFVLMMLLDTALA